MKLKTQNTNDIQTLNLAESTIKNTLGKLESTARRYCTKRGENDSERAIISDLHGSSSI